MREVVINGKKRLCFVVTEGEAATIVIPIESIAPVDYRRLTEMSKKGGELMSVMRETVLDNGMNALVQYQNLLVTVRKPKKKTAPAAQKEEKAEDKKEEEKKPAPRPRGRPRKSE